MGTSGNPGFSSTVGAAVGLSGATLLNAIDAGDDCRCSNFHGTNDPLVPYAWAQATRDQGQAAGIISYLTTYEGEGHVPYNHRAEILEPDLELPLLDARSSPTLDLLARWREVTSRPTRR